MARTVSWKAGEMHSLEPLLSPNSIAVVGASEGLRHGGEVMRALRAGGYAGRIVPVNPRHKEVYGTPCLSSLAELDAPVDCVVLAVRREDVPDHIAMAAQAGARAAVVVAGGFGEAGPEGRALEARLMQVAREYGIRLLGPNTIGFINLHAKVGCYAASLPVGLQAGSIGAAVQSGTVAGALGGAGRRLRLSHLVATGNETDVGVNELIEYFADDPDTQVILLFIESVRDAPAFRRAVARASAAGKPVVALRAGSSAAGRAITSAHTGALADDPRVFRAFARSCGLMMVESLNELIVAGELLAHLASRPAPVPGVAVMTHSGGEAASFVDLASNAGVSLPALSKPTVARLKKILPDYHAPANPLDTTGLGATSREVFRACLESLCDDPGIGIVAVMQDIRAGHWVLRQAAEVTAEVAGCTSKPVIFFSNTTRHTDPELDEILETANVPVLYGTREVVTALAAATAVPKLREETARTADLPEDVADSVTRAMAEPWPEALLRAAGVSAVETRFTTDRAGAIEAASRLGYPVALKAFRRGLEHKSDVGGVRLNIGDEATLGEAVDAVTTSVPNAEGFLLQRMAQGVVAELILGLQRDPVYGWVVLVAAGGELTELLGDVSVRLAPANARTAEEMLRELRMFPLLRGFRGRPVADLEAAVSAIVGMSRLASALEGRLSAFEINPLSVLARGEGAIAVDALTVPEAAHDAD